MANIDSAFSSEFLSVNDNVLIANGSINPSTGLGFEAPVGSIYLRTGFGEVYVKFGVTDLNWSLIRSGVINFDDLGDVTLTSPTTGNTIVFDGTNWVNQAVAGTTDQLIKITSADTTANYLQPKLVAGTNVTITKNNAGANETLTIASSAPTSPDEKVKISATDTTSGFLLPKLVAGTNISITQNNISGNETVTLGVSGLTPTSVGLGNVTNNLQVINAGGAPSIQEDTFANRPTFGTAGRLFLATDTNILYRDTGAGWVTIGNAGSVTSISATQPTAGFTITGSPITSSGTLVFTLANDLGAIEGLATTGIPVRTATDTWAIRSLTAPTNGISITNPAGIAGNPTFALTNDLGAIEGLTTTGLAVRTAADTWTTRTLTAGSTRISVTNGDGVAGAPTINLGTVTFDDLSDVVITTPTSGQTVRYNGTNWVNITDNTGTVTSISATQPTTGLTITGSPITSSGTLVFTLANDLNAVENLGTTGLAVRTAADTWTTRAISAGSTKITVTNGDGVAGAPSINLGTVTLDDLSDVVVTTPTSGQVIKYDGVNWVNGTDNAGSGTVTSVAATAPAAGFTVSGSPITSSGTLVFTLSNDLAALEGLATTGMAVRTGADTWTTRTITGTAGRISVTNGDGVLGAPTLDLVTAGTAGTYTSVTTDAYGRVTSGSTTQAWSTITGTPTTLVGYGITDAQPLDGDLTAIAALAGTSGLARKTAANTWTLDTATYLTANQTITISGDATGSGTTSIPITLNTVNTNVGTFGSGTNVGVFTVNGKGLVTAASNVAITFPVTSVFGRTGAIVSAEGDYSLTQLSDVTITTPSNGQHLIYNGTTWVNSTPAASGTVTSVAATAPASGFTITGSPITNSGTLVFALANDLAALEGLAGTGIARRTGADTWSLGTTVSIAEGGTGQTTANAALNALLPTQTGNTGKFITTDGTNSSWGTVVSTDQYVRISNTDTTSNFLQPKILAGTGISIVKSAAGNETITINSTSVVPGDQACIQVRRATAFTTTAAWQDVTFSNSDVLNNISVLDWPTSANITIGQTGPYMVFYKVPIFGTTAATKIVQARVRKNALTVLNGSTSNTRGGSANDLPDCSDSFVVILTAGDTIQLQLTNSAGQTAGPEITFGAVRLSAAVGPQGLAGATGAAGPSGSGSTLNVSDEGSVLSGSPFSNFNFIGAGVIATPGSGGTVNISIPGGTAILKSYVYYPASLDNPINASWIINSLAPMITDPAYGAFNIRQFSNTVENGVGCYLTVPSGAANVTIKIKGRAQTAPGAVSIVQPRLYVKGIPDNATVSAWSAPVEMTNLSIPVDAVFHYYQQTLSLAALSMVAGSLYQLEFTRRVTGLTGGTNLATNWLLIELSFDFT